MRQPILTIFYQYNPWDPTIGGIQTCINYVIKYAPDTFQIRLIGTATDDSMSVGQWYSKEMYGRPLKFFPLIRRENDNIRGLVPTTVKYAAALIGKDFSSDFLQFHRLEPTMLAQHWKGCKILYIHNDIYAEVKGENKQGGILWRYAPWIYFALEKSLVGQFDKILSCNSKSTDLYKERYPRIAERVSYLKNTYDPDVFYALTPEEKEVKRRNYLLSLGLPKNTSIVLFAGRLHPQKDPLLLIRAAAALEKKDFHLLIVGQGELEPDVRAEIQRLQLADKVTILGPMKQIDLANLYRLADVFVLTSVYEGLARGSIEALACGTPVVTTRAGETPNFLTPDTGIVCEERSPKSIAQSLQKVLSSPESFPSYRCCQIIKPYDASYVVNEIYGKLLQDWQQQQDKIKSVAS